MARPAPATPAPPSATRLERTLAVMALTVIGLCVLAILALIISPALGVHEYGGGIWPLIVVLPLVGLPIGFLMLIALLVTNIVRRSRETRSSR